MTQLAALKEMAEKVEAGEKPPTSGFVDEPMGPNTWGHSVVAFHGSLDAAKELLAAVLPGWDARLYLMSDNVWLYIPTRNGPPKMEVEESITGNLARAWLLAIIRAKIAELESEDGRS